MKLKKLIAIVATLTLAMSSMTVLAEEIKGDVNYVDTTIYKVTLPTTASMSFTLDPQGLTALDGEGEAAALETARQGAAGKIVSTTTMTAKNESSVDVVLSADFFIVDSDTETPVTLKGADESITVGDDSKESSKELKLTITTVGAGSDTDVTNNSKTLGVTTSAAGTGTDFTMSAADYTFSGNSTDGYAYTLTPDSGSTIAMTIGGNIAKDYDWSAYTGADAETITLNAVFKFYKEAAKTNEVPTDSAPSIASNGFTYSAANGAEVVVNLGNGTLAATGVASVQWAMDADSAYSALPSPGYTYDADSNTITFPAGLFTGASVGATRSIKVTFNDTAKTAVVLTLTKAE